MKQKVEGWHTKFVTVSHFVELNVLGDVLCKLHTVTGISTDSHQQFIAQREHLVVI